MTERGQNWTDGETFELINVWGEDEIQEGLEGCRNRHIYELIRRKLLERGIQRTVPQVKERMRTLKKSYKKYFDIESKSGRKTCRFFGRLDEVLGNRPPSLPMMLLDNPCSSDVKIEELQEEHIIDDNTPDADVTEINCNSDADAEDLTMSCIAIEETSASSHSPTPLHTNELEPSPLEPTRGKHKRKMTTMEQTLSQMIETFMEKQLQLQNAFFEQEEKRMKLEAELEDKRRREERQHELMMLQMILGKCTDPPLSDILGSTSTSKLQSSCPFS